jgi:CheY-like chemotaxis protein
LKSIVSPRVRIRYEFPPHGAVIEADATQVRQVIMNLITNAAESYEGSRGIITVRVGVRRADRAFLARTYVDDNLSEGPYVFLAVTDEGVGMDDATASKVFDPFFTTKKTGRGLGLAAVLGIVRGHHGAIYVRSRPGGGTTVAALFPQSKRTPEIMEPEKAGGIADQAMGATLLVADDDPQVQRVVRRILEKHGFTILIAGDGREAVETFARNAERIGAVILDMTMPVMDGEKTLQELRKIRPDAKVIISSGYNEQYFSSLGQRERAGFIQKPYKSSQLIQKVREVLQGDESHPE